MVVHNCIHLHFNPRPPWGGRRRGRSVTSPIILFQSTPSVGRATVAKYLTVFASTSISIHALRGEGDFFPILIVILSSEISIHALRGEGDYGHCLYQN